ncbi:DDE_3 domain-containing protein [Trichonephila clavipes]|nr:DDE_3 domain-containing protein [Trichonephila clavipes]
MIDICHYMHEEIEPQLRLNSDPPSLQAPEGWYRRSTVHRRLHELGLYARRPAIRARFTSCSGHVNMSTRRVINEGLISLRMSPDLVSKAVDSIMDTYLEHGTIQCMRESARSPNLNLLGHVWDALGRRVAAPNPRPRTLATLSTALEDQWLILLQN